MNNNKNSDNKVDRIVQWGIQSFFSHNKITNEYTRKLIDAYNTALMLERDWKKISHSKEFFSEIRPDYFQTSLKLFVISVYALEQVRLTFLEYIKDLDDNSLTELVEQVEKLVQIRAQVFKKSVSEIQNGDVKREIINVFSKPFIEPVHLQLFGLYVQSLSEQEKQLLFSCDTEKVLLDSVKKTRKTGEEKFEQVHKLKIESIKQDGFASSEMLSVISTIDSALDVATNELKKLDIVNQLDSHSRLV